MSRSHTIIKAKQKASLLLQANRLADAWDAYERISRQAPADDEVWLNMGAIAAMRGQLERGEMALRRALVLKPNSSQANVNLARLLMMRGELKEAVPYLQKYVVLQPNDALGYYQFGFLLEELNDLEVAEKVYLDALARGLRTPDLHVGLSRLLHRKGEYEQAREQCELALKLKPDEAMAHFGLGQACRELHSFAEAEDHFEQFIKLAPDERESYELNRALLLVDQQQHEAAEECYLALLKTMPESVSGHWNYSLLLLLLGRYEAGLAEYEWRTQASFWKRQMWPGEFVPPRWSGEPLAGRTILIHAEQGFGDTIQFGRYLPLLLAQGARVIFHCQPPLLGLFKRLPGIEVVARDYEAARQTPFDYHLPLMSLAHRLGTTLTTIPAASPYLAADPERVAAWRRRIDPDRFNVGLVWTGSALNPKDRWRSAALEQFAPLAAVAGVTFYSLQKESLTEAERPFAATLKLVDLAAELNDFDDTAAVIENLDLVITIDSAVAHLAGALAKPVWTLVYMPTEWRWLLGRDDSPWYPSMRLFRQTSAEPEWPPVIKNVVAALRQEISTREEY